MMRCEKCGAEVREGLRFCTKCGARISFGGECGAEKTSENASSSSKPTGEALGKVAKKLGADPDEVRSMVNGAAREFKDAAKEAFAGAAASVSDTLENRFAAEKVEPFSDSATSGSSSKASPVRSKKLPKALAISAGALVLLVILVALVSTCQSLRGASTGLSGASGAKNEYPVHLTVKCKKNLIFSRYDLDIKIDGASIAKLDHGGEDSWDIQLEEGPHTLTICKRGSSSVDGNKNFKVSKETSVSCVVSLRSDAVEFDAFSAGDTGDEQAGEQTGDSGGTESQTEQQGEGNQQEGPEAQAEPVPQETSQSEEAGQENGDDAVLTADNCSEMAALFASGDGDASEFARLYAGRTIEFDGNIADLAHHGKAKTRFDVLIHAGDYDPNRVRGPEMRYEDVNIHDMGVDDSLDEVRAGMNVHVMAIVGSYNSTQGVLALEPVSMSAR